MSDSPQTPETPADPRQRRLKEYEDPHYHDEDEVLPSDDVSERGSRPPARRKPLRRPVPRRPHYED